MDEFLGVIRKFFLVLFLGRIKKKENKVIRPKSRASALSKNARQTDGQTISFSKTLKKGLFTHPSFFSTFRDTKNAIKSL